MTVRRERSVRFSSHPEGVRAAIADLLAKERKYRTEAHKDDVWTIRVRPAGWPLVLSTRLDISLEQDAAPGVTVFLSTTSQRLILGDIAGMYDGYIDELIKALEIQLAAT